MNTPIWIPEIIIILLLFITIFLILKIFIKDKKKLIKVFIIIFSVFLISFLLYGFYVRNIVMHGQNTISKYRTMR